MAITRHPTPPVPCEEAPRLCDLVSVPTLPGGGVGRLHFDLEEFQGTGEQ